MGHAQIRKNLSKKTNLMHRSEQILFPNCVVGLVHASTMKVRTDHWAPVTTPFQASARSAQKHKWPSPKHTCRIGPFGMQCLRHPSDSGRRLCWHGCEPDRTRPSLMLVLLKHLDDYVAIVGGGVGLNQSHSRSFSINVHHNVPANALASPQESCYIGGQKLN